MEAAVPAVHRGAHPKGGDTAVPVFPTPTTVLYTAAAITATAVLPWRETAADILLKGDLSPPTNTWDRATIYSQEIAPHQQKAKERWSMPPRTTASIALW